MPELPEVETICVDLKSRILNKKIRQIDVRLAKVIKNSTQKFINCLVTANFSDIKRRGKLLIFDLANQKGHLLVHLRMTGQLIYHDQRGIVIGGHGQKIDWEGLPNKHTHIIIHFSDNSCLFFNDQRQFGTLQIVPIDQLEQILIKFGLEPLAKNFTLAKFKELIKEKKSSIKAFLLDQSKIAGIGNIYADEILFYAKVLPQRKIYSLGSEEIKRTHQAIKKILKKAIQYRGTTFNNYVDAQGRQGAFLKHLKVYQRTGQKCLRCKKGIIYREKIASRSTHFCLRCQR